MIMKHIDKKSPKISKAQNAIIEIFKLHRLPLTEMELRSKILSSGINVNKTTVYRQLARMKENDLIREIDFGDGKKRFETNSGDHHHHLVCTNCASVDEIYIENDLDRIERKISKNKNFKIIDHSLEFFGLCKKCK
jgi:Fur family ferric uptake transcriptional regulator